MKNCEDISSVLIAYIDQKASSAERSDVEEHLAGCAACRTRVEEFGRVGSVLDELPAVEPSFGFDARVRQRVAAEPRPSRFGWFAPQARFAFSAALLVALAVWVVRLPSSRPVATPPAPMTASTAPADQDFDAVKDLGVLEDYDLVTNMDALSQLVPAKAPENQKPDSKQTESND
jgi:anti-sigma factor RsiW